MTAAVIEFSQPEQPSGPLIRVMREDGSLDPTLDPGLSAAEVVSLYRNMVRTRVLDERLVALQRQGRIGFHVGALGEEGAICAATHGMREHDWIFPCYRELGAALMRGFELQSFIDNMFGNARDVVKGRQMPDHFTCRAKRYGSVSSPVGTQITQAVGFAWAARIRKEELATLVYFGDGATSSSDFHSGMNFAGVFKLPVVLFCRNNGWAISLPTKHQTATSSLAVKAEAYGMPGVRVDGNDVFAVVSVVRKAVERASRGLGPTLIEALTYRLGGHSTSDDPDRYRGRAELAPWLSRDPILRLRRFIEAQGYWSDSQEQAMVEEIEEAFKQAVGSAEAVPPPSLSSMFDDVYERRPWHLEEQCAQLVAGPRAPGAH